MSATEEKDVYENWEDMDDTGLEHKINKIINDKPSTMTNVTNGGPIKMILMGDDAYRTHPPEPTVKILKRPPKGSIGAQSNGDLKPRAPIKTLQQREQEYAEARLRILGAAKSPEESAENSVNTIQNRLETSSIDNSTTKGASSRGGPGTNNIQSNNSTKTSDSLIRLPRGPDGSKGFNLRR